MEVSEVRLAEDRPRNISYREGDFEVSISFGWAQADAVPTNVKVAVRLLSRQDNLAVSNETSNAAWGSFEEAKAEGRRVATEMISSRSRARQFTGVQIHQIVYRADTKA